MKVTKKDLESLVIRLNKITNNPLESYTEINGKFVANIGNYHIYSAYGGHKLVQTDNKSGGIRDVISMGFESKGKAYQLISAYLCGFLDGARNEA